MSKTAVTQKEWDIPKRQLNFYNKREIEEILSAFNPSCGGDYYMLDYYHQKIIVDPVSTSVLCGHPKKILEKEGFNFSNRILDSEEQRWLDRVNVECWKLFHSLHRSTRKSWVLSYDLTVNTVNGMKETLHHTVVPFKFCNNTNLWLGLCHAVASASKKMAHSANVMDTETGWKYIFSNDEFIRCRDEILTNKEIQILPLMAKDMTGKQICETLGIALTIYNRHKRSIFDKLGVDKAATAIHKAHIEGII